MAISEPVIRVEGLATGADLALNTLYLQIRQGLVPLPDAAVLREQGGLANGWKLSTIRAWRPDIADRCAAMIAAIQQHPLQARTLRTPLKRLK